MKNGWKILTGVLFAAALALLVAFGTTRSVKADGEHANHCVCAGYYDAASTACPYNDADNGNSGKIHADGVEWTAWTSSDALPTTAGYYYLTVDVLGKREDGVKGDGVYICLNGHKIYNANTGLRAAQMNGNGTAAADAKKIVFTNCGAKDAEHGSISTKWNSSQGGVLWSANNSGNTYELFNVYVDGSGATSSSYGATICLAAGKLYAYNTTIIGGTAVNGGAIDITGNAIFRDSEIRGGSSTNGAAITVRGGSTELYATTVVAGTASSAGDCIYVSAGTLRIYDKSVVDEVYLMSGKYLTTGKLSDGTYIGLKSSTGTAAQVTAANSDAAQNARYLQATDPDKYISYNSDKTFALKSLSDETDAHVTAGHCVCGNTASVTVTPAATAANGHASHDYAQTWIPWDVPGSIPRGFEGQTTYYYLTTDVTTSLQATMATDAKVYICLNGHSITDTHNGRLVSTNTSNNSEYVFTNCGAKNAATGAGWIKNSNTGNYVGQGGIIWMNASDTATVTLYNVGLDGGTHRNGMYGGLVAANKGVFKAYNAEFTNGITYDSNSSKGYGYGGAIASMNSAVVGLYACSVTASSAERSAGSIYAGGGTLTLKDSTVSGGEAPVGGNVYTASGATFDIENSTISGGSTVDFTNSTTYRGGNICSYGTTNFKSGFISGGKAGRGGNVYVAGGAFNMTGGTIENGYSTSGGNLRAEGTFNLSAGTVGDIGSHPTSGTASTNSVFLNLQSTLNMTGGTIQSAVQPTGELVFVNGSVAESTSKGQNATLNLQAGTVVLQNSNKPTISNKGTAMISGGHIYGSLYSGNSVADPYYQSSIAITGGYYSAAPVAAYLADDYYAFNDVTETSGGLTYTYEVAAGYIIDTAAASTTGSLGVAAPVAGGDLYRAGASVTLTAGTVPGFDFVKWTDGEGTQKSTNASYTFTAAASDTYTAVYAYGTSNQFTLTVTGVSAGAYTVSPSAGPFAAGTEVTITYEGGDNFGGWYNGMGKLVSRNAEYRFTIGANTELQARTSAGSALIVFYTKGSIVYTTKTSSEIQSDGLPAVPTEHGKENGRWNKTAEAIITEAGSTSAATVEVMPIYDDAAATYAVTVVNKHGDTTDTKSATAAVNIAAATVITADDTFDGAAFSFFAADAAGTEILSYTKEITVRFETNTTIYAIYGASVTAEPVTVTMVSASSTPGANSTKTIFFEALRSAADSNTTILEQGILFTWNGCKGATIANAAEAADNLYVGSATCNTFISSGIQANDTTGLTMKNVPTAMTIYARGYVIYRLSDGTKGIAYSDVAVAN